MSRAVERSVWGATPAGEPVERFVLESASGLRAQLIALGATLTALEVPDRRGLRGDVVLGFDGLRGYLGDHPYFGSTVGRYANRIGGARFVLGGVEYPLARNEGRNHLHGGVRNFARVLWRGEPDRAGAAVVFHYRSADGEEGYPGNLDATVRYALGDDGALRIELCATSDAPTVVNLTHHSYFDLSAGAAGGVHGHTLELAAERYAVVDAEQIPTGELRRAAGTPLDFAAPRRLGDALAGVAAGFDHSYALSRGGELAFAARLSEAASGRVMELYTTQPALQLYTGNHLDGSLVGKGGVPYRRHSGVCLEAQNFPDAPNQPGFPSAALLPGERYRQRIEYRFGNR